MNELNSELEWRCGARTHSKSSDCVHELKNIELGNEAIEQLLSKLQETPISCVTFDLSPQTFVALSVDFLCIFCEVGDVSTQGSASWRIVG
jgi:hypothetical protein